MAQPHGSTVILLVLLYWHRELTILTMNHSIIIIFLRIMFIDSIAMTAMNFILERKEGLFERSYAAGNANL